MSQGFGPQHVFITGALGFIGRRLLDRYRNAGYFVTGVDVRSDCKLGVVEGDITKRGTWQEAIAGSKLVIHTAAKVGMEGDADSYWRINCLGTRHVIDACTKHKVHRLVHLSSVVVFGFEYPDGVDEQYPLRTNGVPYVDSKIASEHAVLQAHAAGDVECTIVRPGDVYGPGSNFWTVAPLLALAARRLILPAMGRGHLAPIFVDDLVRGVMLAAGSAEASGQVFNLTGGEKVEAREFFGFYARMLRKARVPVAPTAVVTAIAATMRCLGRGPVTAAAVRYIARKGGYSVEKARQQLGFEPTTSLEEGMRRTKEWFEESQLPPTERLNEPQLNDSDVFAALRAKSRSPQ